MSSAGVGFYQTVLRKALASECTFFPSDSAYTQILVRSCGGFSAMFKGMSRFLAEPDAANQGFPIVKQGERILFEDLPDDCT